MAKVVGVEHLIGGGGAFIQINMVITCFHKNIKVS